MNIWTVAKSRPGNGRLTRTFLNKIETHVLEMSANRVRAKKDNWELSYICDKVLDFLNLSEKIAVCPYEPHFLHDIRETEEVFIAKNSKRRYSLDYIQSNEFLNKDGVYYSTACFTTYKKYNPTTHLLRLVSELTWNIGNLKSCGRCGSIVEEADMVYNASLETHIDKACDYKLANWQNPLPDLSDPIGNYHSHKNTWMFIPQRKGKEKSIPMGVEIEMHSTLGNSKRAAISSASQIHLNHPDNQYYFEWDGSLVDGGFEMVTNPMTLEFHQEWWEPVLKTLRKYAVGYSVEQQYKKNNKRGDLDDFEKEAAEGESYDYGIHVTISRKNIPDAAIAKLCKFFGDSKNKAFLWAVAQRAKMYGGYTLGSSNNPKLADTLIIKDKKVAGGVDRRQPVNIKGTSFIEFRLFRSTLNQVSFLKNLEFIDAIINYLKSAPGVKVDHRTFILWLQKPENSKRYPNLLTYLQHPLFFVKGAGKVKNDWLDLFTDYKLVIRDPLKEYGPKLAVVDQQDLAEGSMI